MDLPAMISYAQNAEDVILRRAFPAGPGFYVDLGAGYPTVDSVTKAFSDRGWRGINVEPQPHAFQLLQQKRPHDINLDCVVGEQPGTTTLTIYPGAWGWATTSPHVSSRLNGDHETLTVQQLPLSDILDKHVPDGTAIDFLKIDIEGAEQAALASLDLARWRPRALVIEATAPNSTRPTHEQWEHLLTGTGYRCAQFDGLNRYYADPRAEPHVFDALSIPANVFDRYVSYQYWRLIPAAARRGLIANWARQGWDVTALEAFETGLADLRRELSYIQRRELRHRRPSA